MKLFLCVILYFLAISKAQSIGPVPCYRPNELYSCGGACQPYCQNYSAPCPIINIRCNDMCYCRSGYARDRTGTCVPYEFCDDRNTGICGENEEYCLGSYYNNECRKQLLSYVDASLTLGCFCKRGYKRDSCGHCIAEHNCPEYSNDGSYNGGSSEPVYKVCNGRYEHFDCGDGIQRTCDTAYNTYITKGGICVEDCYCNDGYVRNCTGGCCIPIQKCSKTKICGLNEHYECGDGIQRTCETAKKVLLTPAVCVEGCYCDDGYVRNSDGKCIRLQDCCNYNVDPIICDRPNEHYECGSACQTECETLGQTCPVINIRCNDDCYCNTGYARDALGNCIPISKCPKKPNYSGNGHPIKCYRLNEYYKCGSACQTECATLGRKCNIVNKKCNHACYCREGYARDASWNCIPMNQCFKKYY